MSVACLHIPHFGLRVALLAQPELDGHPLILSDPHHGHPSVLDATPEARQKGIRTGLPLREASALVPNAIIIAPDPAAEHEQLHAITAALDTVSPLVQPAAGDPGTWYIDLTGLGRHYGTTREAGEHLLRQVHPGLRPRAGIAISKFAARVAANRSAPGTVSLIPPARTQAMLADAPVELLPLDAGTIHELHLMGIETLGQFVAIPRARIGARFGPAGQHAWDLVTGDANDPVEPPARELTVAEYLELPAPATSHDVLMFALKQLVHRAFRSPDLRYRHAREITMRAGLEHGRSWQRSMVFKDAYGPDRLVQAIGLRMQYLEMPGPVESLTVEIQGIVETSAHQAMLPALRPRHLAPLSHAVSILKQRYGLSPLFRIVEVEPWSRIPERRHALVSFDP
ncbi:MAG: DNA polymerase Y family protein [Chloroflexota bacterium]|nr:DNA polymerase Y family protein [Chloroflexota bacterium]